jgi:hypothetical protein
MVLGCKRCRLEQALATAKTFGKATCNGHVVSLEPIKVEVVAEPEKPYAQRTHKKGKPLFDVKPGDGWYGLGRGEA